MKERRRELSLPDGVEVCTAGFRTEFLELGFPCLGQESIADPRNVKKFVHSCITILSKMCLTGDVSFPDDHGENQPAEMFALL